MNKITRIWHGRTLAAHGDEYLQFVEESGMKDYRLVKGNLSAKLLRRTEGNICHFMTITEWDDVGSIKRFAGEDYEKAKYYPGDEKYLLEMEEKVVHYQTTDY